MQSNELSIENNFQLIYKKKNIKANYKLILIKQTTLVRHIKQTQSVNKYCFA
jgi:hypothetical protein